MKMPHLKLGKSMYRSEHQHGLTHINILNDQGGLGDAVAILPAIKYIADYHKHIQIHFWVQDFFVEFAKNCLRNTNVIVRGFSEKAKYKEHFIGKNFSSHRHDNMATHLTDHAFHVIVNKQVADKHKNYLQPDLSRVNIDRFNLPERYIIMTTGYTAQVREMLPNIVNEVNKYIVSKGYAVVFLGKRDTSTGLATIKGNFKETIDYSLGINLIDKTSLLETTKIIANAATLVGLDNGLHHIAGCTNIPIVAGYTTVEACYRMPYRNNILGHNCYPVVPEESLQCRFCQSNMVFEYNHDFRECLYQDYACVKMLTADKYIEQLEKIL